MRDVCADFGRDLAGFNGDAEHVRLLLNFPLPATGASRQSGSGLADFTTA